MVFSASAMKFGVFFIVLLILFDKSSVSTSASSSLSPASECCNTVTTIYKEVFFLGFLFNNPTSQFLIKSFCRSMIHPL